MITPRFTPVAIGMPPEGPASHEGIRRLLESQQIQAVAVNGRGEVAFATGLDGRVPLPLADVLASWGVGPADLADRLRMAAIEHSTFPGLPLGLAAEWIGSPEEGLLVIHLRSRVSAIDDAPELAAQLDAGRALLAAVIEAVPAGLLVIDSESGRVLLSNARIRELLNTSPLDADAIRLLEISSDGERRLVPRAAWPEKLRERREGNGKAALLLEDSSDTVRPVEAVLRRVEGRDGGSVADVLLVVDRTQERVQANRLHELAARLGAILRHAPLGIAIADLEGHVLSCSPRLERFLGYDEGGLRGKHFATVTHPADADRDCRLFRELLEGKRSHYSLRKRYVTRRGRLRYARLRVTLLRDEDGRPEKAIALVDPLSGRKRQGEARLQDQGAPAGAP